MTGTTTRARCRLGLALAGCWLVAPLLLAVARWPSWWTWIAPEQTPMTWLQSVALVLAAAATLLIAHLLTFHHAGGRGADGRPATEGHVRPIPDDTRVWRLLAAGLAALAIDERFALHERVRDGVLAPRDVTVPFLPWVGPGDFLLLAVGVVGLAVLPLIWRAMGDDRGARVVLHVGVGLAVVAVGMDSIDPTTWTTSAERVQQTAEEVIELGSGLALLAAVTLRLLGLLDRATAAGTPTDQVPVPDTTAPDEVRAP